MVPKYTVVCTASGEAITARNAKVREIGITYLIGSRYFKLDHNRMYFRIPYLDELCHSSNNVEICKAENII
jgi:hypothetical protein